MSDTITENFVMRLSTPSRALVDSLPCNIAAFDARGQIVLVNRAWRKFGLDNGLPEVDWTTVNYLDVCRKASSSCSDAKDALAAFEAILAGRSLCYELEYPCHTPTGEQRWFHMLAVPFDEDGGKRYVLTQHRAITERRLLQIELDQAHKMEAIGRLASGVAHDFNNLLMGIAGAATIGLKRAEADSPLRYYFDEIKNAAVGGSAITKQLLAFSRKSSASHTRQDIDEIVLTSEGMLHQLMGESIAFEIHGGCSDGAVRCADGQIVQILMNLVVNARDAMGGSGIVKIATKWVEIDEHSLLSLDPGRYCLLTVSDTGVGMDVPTQRRIFEPFFTTKGVGLGTGLGLSTVYGIVRGAGGLIRVVSEVGRGTTFEVYLPRFELEAEPASSPPKAPASGSETVLVVEDETLVRDTVREYLLDAGYHVLVAKDGDEARQICRRVNGAIDLLLTDMVLPGISGAEVAREIRRLAPKVGVVFMSAHPREMLLDSGRVEADELVLHKPFDDRVLLPAIREALQRGVKAKGTSPGPVLLVDDDELCRDALAELFAEAGYTVIQAASAGEALRRVSEAQGEIGIVVTDFKLPDFDADEMIERIAAQGPLPPVLFFSGRSAKEPQVVAALQRPRTQFIEKPVEFDKLLATLEDLLAST